MAAASGGGVDGFERWQITQGAPFVVVDSRRRQITPAGNSSERQEEEEGE